MIRPIHPGKILESDFILPYKLSQYRVAEDINIPARRINEIVHGTRSISADTALRLARYFGTTAQFWINLQSHYELECERDASEKIIEQQVKVYAST